MLYNYKLDELVQDVIVDDLEDIVDDIIEEYVGLRRNDYLTIYAPVYIMNDILPSLINSDLDLYVDDESEFELLEDVHNIVIATINYKGDVIIEDAYGKNGIKHSDAILTYFYDGIKQSDLENLSEDKDASILAFGLEDESEDEEENNCMVYVSVDDNGTPHGFCATWFDECDEGCNCYQSYSVYSTCPTRVVELAEIFGIDL